MTKPIALTDIAPGDLVLVSKRGRIFHARVLGAGVGGLTIAPLERAVRDRHAGAGEILDHWRHTSQPAAGVPDGQLQLDELPVS